MPIESSPTPPPAAALYSEAEIKRRIDSCPKLASLQSVNRALSELIRSEVSLNSQIADIIRRDPSLSARLLRMVNSVYFGLSTRVNNIEEAVFFLGLRQIRELSLATPVLEELEQFQAKSSVVLPWKELWSHSIGSAILTREILASTTLHIDDDTDYLVGLLHNVGKVVMAYAFPQELALVMSTPKQDPIEVCQLEREVIGWDHARIGAYYLERHQLPPEITVAVQFHHDPERAEAQKIFAAGVQVADCLVRFTGVTGGFEQVAPTENEAWIKLDGWTILYGSDENESRVARAAIANSLRRLPSMLNGLL